MADAVFFFCVDPDRDPVAGGVLAALRERLDPEEGTLEVDGRPVLLHHDDTGHRFHLVATDDVVSHDYPRYLPVMRHFAHCAMGGVVNWHEGANAPDRIFCLHTTGDVTSGHFGPADPRTFRNLLRALDGERRRAGLDDYRVTSEATHWSGIPHGGDPATIADFPVPLLDVEIGSGPDAWSDPAARGVLAAALPRVFAGDGEGAASLLCVGGVHFQEIYGAAVLASPPGGGVAVSHILANQWVGDEAAGYGGPRGVDKLRACVASIAGGVDAVVYHASLKAPYKNNLRALGEELGVPVLKHRALRRLDELPL